MKTILYLLFMGSVLSLPACSLTGVAAGVGASAGIAAAQEGGISRALSDARIQTQINDLWFRHDIEMFRKLDLTVKEGRVLVTGVVQNPEHRVEAIRLAWQPKGVTQVINEVRVANSAGVIGYAKDAWISGRLRTALMFNKDVQSINYTIDTVQGTIYLMGFALSQTELNKVIEIARTIPNVKQVVSYVKIVGADSEASTPYDASEGPAKESPASDPWDEGNASEPVSLTPPAPSNPSAGNKEYQDIQSEELLWDEKR